MHFFFKGRRRQKSLNNSGQERKMFPSHRGLTAGQSASFTGLPGRQDYYRRRPFHDH